MAKILVTGGVGFIGSHVVDELVRKKHKVIVIDNLSSGYAKNVNSKAKLYRLSINAKKVQDVFRKEKFEFVFHMAGQIDIRKSINDPIADANTNIIGSINIIKQCADYQVRKIIFASTGGAIYGETRSVPATEASPEVPVSPYGIGKLAVEKYLEYFRIQYKLDYSVVRYANVYGPRQNAKGEAGVISIFVNNAVRGRQSVINGTGTQTRDFIYVKDVVGATVMAMTKKGKIMNVSTANETSILELYNQIVKIGGFTRKLAFKKTLPGDQQRSCMNAQKISRQWGFKPHYSLAEGLQETIQWFKEESL